VVGENHGKLNMLNANVNTIIKHVVDIENTKYNKDTITTCGTPYDVHPSKSAQKKESCYKFHKADETFKDDRPTFKKKQHLSMDVESLAPMKTTLMSSKIQIPFAKGFEFNMHRPRNFNLLNLYISPIVDHHPMKSALNCASYGGINKFAVTTPTSTLGKKQKRRIIPKQTVSTYDIISTNEFPKVI